MKIVTMIGYAHSKCEAKWDESEGEIWIMNDMYDFAPRYDRVFDIHSDESILNRITRKEGFSHFEGLKRLKKPVYMQRVWPEIPASVRFPLAEIIKEYHIPAMGDKIFLTCSVAHMLALAIYEGFEEITLLGIDQAIDTEYEVEMPSVLYWLGVAAGKGIKINISDHSPLLKGYYIYGYEDPQKRQFVGWIDKEQQRIEEIKQKAIEHQQYYFAEENKCVGAATILEHIRKLHTEI
jgi:hypothetical protein